MRRWPKDWSSRRKRTAGVAAQSQRQSGFTVRLSGNFLRRQTLLQTGCLLTAAIPGCPSAATAAPPDPIVEFRSFLEKWRERKERTEVEELGRTELKAAKERVRKRVAMYRDQLQHATSRVRASFIRTIEGLSPAARLEHLPWDTQNPLSFYPAALAETAGTVWTEVSIETREALLKRASTIPRGEWRRWWKRHTVSAADTELPIKSRDYWFKIVDFLQQNWALIDPASIGCRVWFFSDTSGVFDQLDFPDIAIAEGALRRNGFARFDEDPEAATFLYKPQPPFVRCPHSNGPIYSSGRFWK